MSIGHVVSGVVMAQWIRHMPLAPSSKGVRPLTSAIVSRFG